MEADTLTRIDTTARLDSAAYKDSTALMLNDWSYAEDTQPLVSTKYWMQDSIQLFYQKNPQCYTRHDGISRINKMMSESLLLMLLLLETLLVAYLVKNGLKILNNSIKGALQQNMGGLPEEGSSNGGQFQKYLWLLSIVVFALMCPVLVNMGSRQTDFEFDSWQFLRFFIYVILYFFLKSSLYKIIGRIFFNPTQTKQWIDASKTTISFYALSLTPILICSEIGLNMGQNFFFIWVIGFLIISKIWLLSKSVMIFSLKSGDFLYLILYLCALEFMPILLFYKGLFLL